MTGKGGKVILEIKFGYVPKSTQAVKIHGHLAFMDGGKSYDD
jgi:hypothetical protein